MGIPSVDGDGQTYFVRFRTWVVYRYTPKSSISKINRRERIQSSHGHTLAVFSCTQALVWFLPSPSCFDLETGRRWRLAMLPFADMRLVSKFEGC